jgi:serine phosphatase RsbU (regulator of sigma subunit)
MLRLSDGSIEKLDTANGMMIGVSSDSVGEIDAKPFPLGSQLVMYTDGLVERRDRPLQLGIDQAVAHLAALSTKLAPHQVIESLHDALIGDKATDDDIAVLVVEHVAAPSA